MGSKITIADDIRYIGVNDHDLDLFEGQYIVPNGMAYNSYVILDEKIAVFDTVEVHFGEEWMGQLLEALDGRTPDYLIVQHMEPDHSANIVRFMDAGRCSLSSDSFQVVLSRKTPPSLMPARRSY